MNKMIDIDAIPGERWFPKETNFEEDMPLYWGEWGVASEVDTLRAVLMRRPGKEIENFDAKEVRFSDEPVDVELMRAQHDAVADIYRRHGVKVYYVEEQREDRPNAIFCRDLVFMTPEGAILTRPGMAARRGEERYIAKALSDIGVPNNQNCKRRRHVRGCQRHVGGQTYMRRFNRKPLQQERI